MVRGIPLTRRHLMMAMAGSGAMLLGKPRFALAQDGSVLKVRSYSDIQVMDPAFRLSAPEGDIMRAIYTGLVTFKTNADWGWELDGAEMINQVDDTHIEFRLKPGIMFTNGFGEMTAEDVKFSYERFIDPALEAPYKDDFAVLKEVQVTDKYSGVIVLNEPFAPLWTSTLPTESGNIMSKAAVMAAGGKLGVEVPCSSGPYLLKEWQPKQKTILAKNPDWTGNAVDFDEIHIYPIEDEKTAELGFEAGDIDFTWVSVSSIKRLTDTPPAGGVVAQRPSLAYVWLGMNVENPAMQNLAVRRAIQHAIDVPTVLDAAYFGGAAPSTGIIAPGLLGNRAANLYGYDPEKSKALLAEAGLADGFECTLDCLNKTDRVNLATAIQAQLAEVGIKVNVQAHDSGVFWTLGDQTAGEGYKNLQLILSRFSMNPDPSWATAWFTPDQIGIWNWERWNSPEFGEMHKQGLVESDPAKRDELYRKMQDMMEESGAYVFLTHEAVGVLHRDTVVPGMQPNGTPIFPGMKKA